MNREATNSAYVPEVTRSMSIADTSYAMLS